jgi:4-hydroxy-tetrahydrodipicolinate reductase
MNIALVGYGKMGKAIEEIARSRGHEITQRISSSHPIQSADLSQVDVAIEFTRPELAIEHIKFCVNQKIPIVVGTTAWQDPVHRRPARAPPAPPAGMQRRKARRVSLDVS